MRRRAWIAIVPLLITGSSASCALVSGLDGITVVQPGADGGVPDASTDATMDGAIPDGADAASSPDVQIVNDARAGSALRMTSMCGTYQVASDATSYSNKDFTVAFWYQPLSMSGLIGRYPIVWRGGRAAGENGWMIGIEGNALVACVADPNGGTCTTVMNNWTLPLNHLLHVVLSSKVGMNAVQRTFGIYVLDATNNDKGHLLVASASGQNNWNLPLGLAIGGAVSGPCAQNVSGVIDDLRLWGRQLSAVEIDGNYKTSISCSDLGLTSNYRFDEGIGASTEDCAGKLHFDLKGQYTWVASPFP